MKKLLVVLTALCMPTLASADPKGHLDLYFVPSAKLDITVPGLGSGDDDGDGFGVRGLGRIGEAVALTGEYQSTSYDDSDIDIDQLRLGLGLVGSTGSGVFIEYVDIELDGDSADGFGIHGRLASDPAEAIGLYAQVGYLSIEDDFEKNTGPEFSVGAVVRLNPNAGAFVDFRRTQVEGEDSEIEFELTDIRAGVRFVF